MEREVLLSLLRLSGFSFNFTTQQSFLGVNLLSREVNSQTGHRMTFSPFHPCPGIVWLFLGVFLYPPADINVGAGGGRIQERRAKENEEPLISGSAFLRFRSSPGHICLSVMCPAFPHSIQVGKGKRAIRPSIRADRREEDLSPALFSRTDHRSALSSLFQGRELTVPRRSGHSFCDFPRGKGRLDNLLFGGSILFIGLPLRRL
jgi:hypothetical protein